MFLPFPNHLRRKALFVAVSSAALALAGCGGGGSSGSGSLDVSVTPSIAVASGQTASISGFATTAGQSITSATWTQIGGPAVTLSNANCATAGSSKISSAASSPTAATLGNYTCTLAAQIPPSTTQQSYQFQFTVTDSLGHTQTATATVTAKPATVSTLTAVAGPNAGLYPGQTYKGTCTSTGGFYTSGQSPTYQWSIQGPAGIAPPALVASGPKVQLTAPALPNNTNFALTCLVADGAGNTATGTANLTVYGTSSLPALVANAGAAQVVTTGSPVLLSGSASTASGAPSAPVYYYWQQTGGANTVTLANANTATPSFIAPSPPSGASAPVSGSVYDTLTFQVYTSYQPITPANAASVPSSQTATTVVQVVNK